MTFRTFTTDKEFNQASFDNVARLVAQRACTFITTGHSAKKGLVALAYIEDTLILNQLNPVHVSTYLDIVTHENQRANRSFD